MTGDPLRNGNMAMNILMVLTSHAELGDTGRHTGFWLEGFAAPYYVFEDAGCRLTLASPQGGRPPVDPRSTEATSTTKAARRFKADLGARGRLGKTHPLRDLASRTFDAVFFVGGHGPLWDLADDPHCGDLVEAMLAASKPVAAVCHAPGVLRHARLPGGKPVVQGKRVTGFSNTEEQILGLTEVVPFLVEEMLTDQGGVYSKGRDWQPHVVADGPLITGQNPASAEPAARALLRLLLAEVAPTRFGQRPSRAQVAQSARRTAW